jgi:NitT/TauT family transport system substrate-binding protein
MDVTETEAVSTNVSRRAVLRGAGASAAVGTIGDAFGRAPFAVAAPRPKVRLAWTEVAACHAPLAFGVAKGFFAKHNVDVELFYQGASGQTLIQALATNKADVGAGLVLDWLKPLEQGFDVKLFVGMHGGCQRLLASPASGITTLQGLKGKTIAVADLAGPAKLSFSVTLAKNGIDPDSDVNWQVFPWDLVGEAVHRGDAQALAQFDPWAYGYWKDFNLTQLADTQTKDWAGAVCCVLGVNGPFLKANLDAVRRVAAGNLDVHEYTADHPEEVAQWYFDNLKPGISYERLRDNLAGLTYHDHPVGDALTEQVRIQIEDMKLIKVIDPDTDARELAHRITTNVLA